MGMFDKNFQGTTEQFLNHILSAPQSEIDAANDPDRELNRDELIAFVMEDFQVGQVEAEAIVQKILEEEVRQGCESLVAKGFLEIADYNDEGQPRYQMTEKAKKLFPPK
jgi:hypothetical protein